MRRILFLDIDGVLNDTAFVGRALSAAASDASVTNWNAVDYLDAARIVRLNRLLTATSAEVVISSSWRNNFKRPKLVELLRARGFTGRVVGQTPCIAGHERHVEISRWLALPGVRVDRFVILDDDTRAGVGFGDRYVFVADGLEDHHVQRAIRLLS